VSEPLQIDVPRTALLLCDFQRDICERGGRMAPTEGDALSRFEAATHLASRALASAREAGMRVVHIGHITRMSQRHLTSRNPLLQWIRDAGGCLEGSEGVGFVSSLEPRDSEPVIHKGGISAFSGTELERLMHDSHIDHLLIAGIATHFVVEGTARDAADRGFGVTVLGDACASGGSARHVGSLDVLRFIARVASVVEVEAALA
jgi:nicotinamidase-related amidase